MLIGYVLLASSKDKDALSELLKIGCQKIYTDTRNAPKGVKPGLEKALKAIQEGDILAISKLDCLGTNVGIFIEIVELIMQKKAVLKIIEENLSVSSSIDANKLSYLYNLFRKKANQSKSQARTQTIKQKNSTMGRPKSLSDEDIKYGLALLSKGKPREYVCQKLEINLSTSYRYFPVPKKKKINI